MARRPDRGEEEVLSEKDLKELRHNLAHLSAPAVLDFYEQAYRDCRLVYRRLPSPKKIQTLVQVWKQLCGADWGPKVADMVRCTPRAGLTACLSAAARCTYFTNF
jgi:hypothetical protein